MNIQDKRQVEAMLMQIVLIAKLAGQAIMDVYQKADFDVSIKDDQSPVTAADLAAHDIIIEQLTKQFPKIECLSEESQGITFAQRQNWQQCFIIDPLDGTKEFIARNDDFTVNIALVINGKSELGVIYAPVFDTCYYAATGIGAFKQKGSSAAKKIQVRKVPVRKGEPHLTIVNSRRHGLEKARQLCKNFVSYESASRGSSLKMCLIAEGKADFYPRLAPTSEWDTAAAQSIVEQAGGSIRKLDYQVISYNQKESLLNPSFLVLGDPLFDWKTQLGLDI